jgi:hypothetical protein
MRNPLPYPSSFPDEAEERLIRLVLSSDAEFRGRWDVWKQNTVFDDIDFATLRLLPLLYLRLSSLGIEDDEITGRIRGTYKLAWFRNQQLLAEVRKFVELCQEQSVPVILLKGLALLIDVYGDIGARFVADGDLLIDPKDFPKVFSHLERNGWKSLTPLLSSGGDWETCGYANLYHSATYRNDKGLELDLHSRPFHIDHNAARLFLLRDLPPVPEVNTRLWQNSVVVEFNGVAFRVLSREDMLVHIIEHGSLANPHRPIRWVVDAAHIIRKGPLNWDRVLESARKAGLEVHLRLALRYLNERVGVVIPASVMTKLEALPLTNEAVKSYYRMAKWRSRDLGQIPRLWYIYWKANPDGHSQRRWSGFPRFLRHAWGVEESGGLRRYVLAKVRQRVSFWQARKAQARLQSRAGDAKSS